VSDPLEHLRRAAADREAAAMRRTLRPRSADEDLLDLASNDYLGLARDPQVTAAAAAAAARWGAGSTGSRLVTGSTDLHRDLEGELASFVGAAAGLVFSSGYLANLGAVPALADEDTLVVSDRLVHASLVDACRLSRAEVAVVPHTDVDAVRRSLAHRRQARALVVTDSVFSVDGDLAPLVALHDAAREHGALLLVDEAHALGVVGPGGRGAVAAVGLAGEPDVVVTVTLSKSLGSQGGAVLADTVVVEHLMNTARPFVFDTGLAPAPAAAALAALGVLQARPELPDRARANAIRLAALLAEHTRRPVSSPAAAVVSVLVGDPGDAVAAAQRLRDGGILVGCFRPPSVPDAGSRLRFTARADLTDADLDRAVRAAATALA
jgi:8-amino-7-oxononanoate synthase